MVQLDLAPDRRAGKAGEAAEGVARHDVDAVNSVAARKLYKKRVPVYPKLVHGRYRALKWGLLALTLGIYYVLPWVRWPRGVADPSQAVLVDFAHSRFYFFFIKVWPDQLYLLTGLLVVAALSLFLATALFGRVWCGYACPQTVWTDLYIAAERLIEGDRNQRMKLSKSGWTAEKIIKKTAKHAIWLVIAAATGGAWVFYFHDAPTVFPQIFAGTAPASAYLFIGVLTFTTYALAGTMREQVCTYMCPWPRIQAALTDDETLQVTYRSDRGEPRGAHKKGESWSGRGDCVDCRACVAACPMGIDIRDGAQLECINCALCIDACDDVMAKIGRPRGLIAYDTDKNISRRSCGEKPKIRPVRARTVFYAVVLSIVGGALLFALGARKSLTVAVVPDRAPPFVRLSNGDIRNAYAVKIRNKAADISDIALSVEGPASLSVSAIGAEPENGVIDVAIGPDGARSLRVLITMPPARAGAQETPLRFVAKNQKTGETVATTSAFMTGAPK